MRLFRKPVDPRQLASAKLEIAAHDTSLRALIGVIGVLVSVGLALWLGADRADVLAAPAMAAQAAGPATVDPARLAQAEARASSLTVQVAALEVELEMEQATRQALEQEMTALHAELDETRRELEFIKSQRERKAN